MNSDVRKFFEQHILPLHQKATKAGNSHLHMEFRTSGDTYFSSPQFPELLYLNNIPMANETELEIYLKDFWKNEPGLLTLIPDFIKLVFQLKEENTEQSAELSPFVYAMF